DERSPRARPELVQRARHELLAGAALAAHQHRHHRRRDEQRALERRPQPGILADDGAERRRPPLRVAPAHLVGAAPPLLRGRARHPVPTRSACAPRRAACAPRHALRALPAAPSVLSRISYSQEKSNNGGYVGILPPRVSIATLSRLVPREHAQREANLN